jgi:predicted Zn-dependent protease
MLGMVKKEQQDRKEALSLFMKAWTRDPNNRVLLNTLGDFFLEENKPGKAKQYLEMSLFLYPEQEEVKEKLGALK